MIRVVSRKLYFCSVIIILLCVIYSLLGRFVVSTAPEYRPQLERWLSQQLNAPVKIGALEGGWEIINPVIRITDLRIDSSDAHVPMPHVRWAQLQVQLFKTVFYQRLYLRGLAVRGVAMTLEKDAQGHLQIIGIPPTSKPLKLSQWLDLILSQERIALKDIHIKYRHNAKEYEFSSARMLLGKEGLDYQLSAQMQLQQQQPLDFIFIAKGRRDVSAPLGWLANFYIKLDPAEIGSWLANYPLASIALQHANLSGEMWGGLGQRNWLQGTLKAKQISLYHQDKQEKKWIPYVAARIRWQQSAIHGWRLLLDQVTMQYGKNTLHNERFFVEQKSLASPAIAPPKLSWQVQASRVPIPWLREAVLWIMPMEEKQQTLLAAMQTQGELNNISVRMQQQAQGVGELSGYAHFSHLSSQAVANIPGFSGMNGFIAGNQERGVLTIHSQQFGLNLADIFRWPLQGQYLSTALRWERDAQHNMQIETGLLNVLIHGARGRGLLSMTFPEHQSPILRLNATAWNGDGRDTPKYLPIKSMSPGLVTWLDTAIVSGHLVEGQFLFNGEIAEQASLENRRHTFQMRYQVDQAQLAYQPPWPTLTSVTADALILGRSAEIQLKKGQLLQGSQATGLVTVPYFSSVQVPHLRVAAQIASNTQDGIQVLRTSPIRESLSDVVDQLQGQGPLAVQLNLDIPLAESTQKSLAPKINVDVDLHNIQLGLTDVGLSAQQLQGSLHYDESKGLQASQLKGLLLGGPVSAQIVTQTAHSAKKRSETRILASGNAQIAALQAWLKNPLWRFVEGKANYQGEISIHPATHNKPADSSLMLRSNLQGIQIALPKPFAKSMAEKKPFSYRMNLSGINKNITFQVGDDLKATFFKTPQAIQQAQIIIGKGSFAPSSTPGISIQSRSLNLDLASWTHLISSGQKSAGLLNTINPRDWPALNISLDALKVGQQDWGSWHIQTQPSKEGLQLKDIDVQVKELHFTGKGLWATPTRGIRSTQIKGQIEAKDIYDVMQAWKYMPSATSQDAKTIVDLTWPGAPWDFSFVQVKGHFDVSVNKGKLLEVSATSSSSIKAIGLFNIQNLLRRLQLDFSDLFKKGVSYDRMQGHFDLAQNVLTTPNFSITGPSIQFVLKGKAYLDKQVLDQQLSLTIPVARNLVVPAAVIGGVPAAATVYVLDKTFGSRLDKLSTFHFKLTGDWNNPIVIRDFFK